MKLAKSLHDLMLAVDEFDMNFDSFSLGQLESKEWLINIVKTLNGVLGTTYVLCGWYGILPWMMFLEGIDVTLIRSFDIDYSCEKIADRINKYNLADAWKFHAVTEDINNINFNGNTHMLWSYQKSQYFEEYNTPYTIINTSCEHTTPKWFYKIPEGKQVILQSTNFYDGEGHINCVNDLSQMKAMYHMREIFYYGELETKKYKRFMLIGII